MIRMFLMVLIFTEETKQELDPCFTKNVIDNWKRSVANEVTDSSQICDVTLSEGWYRVISGAGELMPTVCPVGGFRCGTTAPYWLSSIDVNGSLYPDNGNTVTRTTCKANYNSMCCEEKIDIQIKDCNCYFVYYLKPTTGCNSAYCFGNGLPCLDGMTSSNGFTPGCRNSSN
ncbi:pancreatic secretory granule membrane major glycoprotein GP2-like isoform X2 [Mytilus galloprovincialis]|uniref:pancreatic secretory granule membrane major glycoprotein GP2-like isoform X2 n=1 Tax=Mytilus galloprovincialis TaxID=29158 RepID=UPI003F7CA4D5